MLQSVVLLLCVACALSQVPTRPVMPETFTGEGDVEFHGAELTETGTFVMTRDYEAEKAYESEQYEPENGGILRITAALVRYDMNRTYYIRGAVNEPHCLEEVRNFNDMPKFWEWLNTANYEGTTKVREVTYDLWGNNVGGVRFEFGKPQSNSSIPYFYRRKDADSSTYYSFFKFQTLPDPALFEVPDVCKAN